jgi:hypothetical protein
MEQLRQQRATSPASGLAGFGRAYVATKGTCESAGVNTQIVAAGRLGARVVGLSRGLSTHRSRRRRAGQRSRSYSLLTLSDARRLVPPIMGADSLRARGARYRSFAGVRKSSDYKPDDEPDRTRVEDAEFACGANTSGPAKLTRSAVDHTTEPPLVRYARLAAPAVLPGARHTGRGPRRVEDGCSRVSPATY